LKESQVLIYDQIIIRITSYNTDAHWSSTQTLLKLNMDTPEAQHQAAKTHYLHWFTDSHLLDYKTGTVFIHFLL